MFQNAFSELYPEVNECKEFSDNLIRKAAEWWGSELMIREKFSDEDYESIIKQIEEKIRDMETAKQRDFYDKKYKLRYTELSEASLYFSKYIIMPYNNKIPDSESEEGVFIWKDNFHNKVMKIYGNGSILVENYKGKKK